MKGYTMYHRRLIVAIVGLLGIVCVVGTAQDLPGASVSGGEEDGESEVTIEARLEPERQVPGAAVVVKIGYEMPDDWYIYADTVGVDIAAESDAGEWVSTGHEALPRANNKYDEVLDKNVDYYSGKLEIQRVLYIADDAPQKEVEIPLKVEYQACSSALCYPPEEKDVSVRLEVLTSEAEAVEVEIPEQKPPGGQTAGSGQESAELGDMEESGIVGLVVFSYLAGLALALTPCVYPMIPITMSVIGATSSESWWGGFGRSLVYVLGISLMYATLGLIAAATGNVFGTLMQHPAVYLGLAVVFVVLAAAMFDLFSIQLFGSWTSRLQQKVRGRAGLVGILVLGVLSGVALTPCSAPVIIGAMGFVLRTRNLWAGFLAFFCIAWGMGTPLVLVGTFGGVVNSLPKSGEWQDTVKHIFGFGLIAAALYFFLHSGLLSDSWSDAAVGSFLIVCAVFAGAFDRLVPESGWWPRLCKSVGLLFVVAAAFVLSAPFGMQKQLPEEGIMWEQSAEEGEIRSQQQEGPMMIYFWQENCPECDRLAQSTFVDPRVVERSREMVCVKFDGTNAREESVKKVLNRYGVLGFPTIVFVAPNGEIIDDATRVGYVDADELVRVMDMVFDAGSANR
ncbi:MAG: protein-disulfide reductase DsbD family protein [Planctomycetota bacterium]